MDEVTAAARRSLKESTVAFLKAEGAVMLRSIPPDLDARVKAYAKAVLKDPERHNLFELLCLRRFFAFLDRYEFRSNRVRAVVMTMEAQKFPTQGGMRPIKLSPVQVYAIAAIYGFYRPDGRRLTRSVLLFVPRKFGKTTLVAGIAIYELLFGDADGQVYVCANSYQQAKICFDNIRNSLKALDRTHQRFKVNREAIYNLMKGRASFARCLASDPTTLDGLNASCYILDEYSQARSADLRNVMATSTGARENPLELIITTASDREEGPCASTLDAYERILLGEVSDDSVFPLIFVPDVDDREDDPATWAKVQPHIGVTVQQDYYEQAWQKAQQTAENMLAFRTKLLNVFAVNESKVWISGDEVRDLFRPFDFDALDPDDPPIAMVAFDLSVWDDFSAVAYEIYDKATASFHFHVDYYLPEGSVDRHPRAALYRTWADKGWLRLLPGNVIDYEAIVQDILSRNGKVIIAGIGYDPWHSKTAVNMLSAAGAASVMKPLKQTYGAFTGSVEALEMLIKTGKCSFSPNGITAWCFGNCVIDEDKIGNRKPIKRALADKIDGAICCLMAQQLYMEFKR